MREISLQLFIKKCLPLLFVLMVYLPAFSQHNLVLNPSFEADSAAPPIQKYYWRRYASWKKDSLNEHNKYVLTKGWFPATGGTPDFLNSYKSSLFGFRTETARTGRGRFGIIAGASQKSFNTWLMQDGNYCEYLETRLTQTLEAGKIYCVRYFVSLDKRSHFCANDFGAVVSKERITDVDYKGSLANHGEPPNIMSANNHYVTSKEGWVMICDTFIATGEEQYLTIGSFMEGFAKNRHDEDPSQKKGLRWMPDCKYAYYYIDDVSLVEVKPTDQLCVLKDTVARNNVVILIDVSGSMEQKKFIDSVKLATYDFANSLNPADLISIIAFESDAQVLVSNLHASDTAGIRKGFEHMHTGGATNIGLAIQAAYSEVRKNLLDPGNNKIILITDGHIEIKKEEKEKMLAASANEGIEFSIVFFGKKVPDDMVKLATDLNGTSIAGPPSIAAESMKQNVPADAIATPYGKCKPGKIILWHVLTKVFFPLILVGMCLYKLGTLGS